MFRNLLSPENRERLDTKQKRTKTKRGELRKLSSKDLADRLEYCVVNCSQELTHRFNLTTYEDALFLVYLPELLVRLRGEEEAKNNYNELARRIQAQDND